MVSHRDNIIYIMPDQWRYDALGVSNPHVKTPCLDALAQRGVVYSAAYCDSPVCQPSRASIMTGTTPRRHGLYDNEMSPHARGARFPSADSGTFPLALQRSGYSTALVGKLNVVFPEWELTKERRTRGAAEPSGLDDLRPLFGSRDIREFEAVSKSYGFDVMHEEADKQSLLFFDSGYTDYLRDRGMLTAWREKVFRDSGEFLFGMLTGRDTAMYGSDGPLVAENLPIDDTLDSYIGLQADRVLRTQSLSSPFFLWVCFVGPHPPFDAPAEAASQYADLDVPTAAEGELNPPDNAWGRYLEWVQLRSGSGALASSDRPRLLRQYYASCSLIDRQVGRLCDTLDELGLSTNTWIVFGSDHGELLGDYRLIQKRLFYRGSVQVPLLVVPPKGRFSPTSRSSVTDQLVQNIDISATLVGVADAGHTIGDGRSLWEESSPRDIGRSVVTSYIADFGMVYDGRYKLVFQREAREPLFLADLHADPHESVDFLGRPDGRRIAVRLLESEGVAARHDGCDDA